MAGLEVASSLPRQGPGLRSAVCAANRATLHAFPWHPPMRLAEVGGDDRDLPDEGSISRRDQAPAPRNLPLFGRIDRGVESQIESSRPAMSTTGSKRAKAKDMRYADRHANMLTGRSG
jgi:hypothetical protein